MMRYQYYSRFDVLTDDDSLTCFWKITIIPIVNKNNNKGILFPDKIIPRKKIINKIGTKYFEYFFEISG